MTTAPTCDPFTAIRDRLPTRYAPGDTQMPYDYPDPDQRDPDTWYPVIYYFAAEVCKGEGRIWLVEPYPAARADGTDGQDPVDSVGVAVLRGTAAPRPRGDDRDGDWIIPGSTRPYGGVDCAYDAYVTNQPDLLAAWCEAWAIAAALNSGMVKALNLKPEDVDVLLAAERGDLTGDSRFAGTVHELRWKLIGMEGGARAVRVGVRQGGRLRNTLRAIEAGTTRERSPRRPDLSSSGTSWTETTYQLTRAGAEMLACIRRPSDGVARCRVCGCTEDRACPDGCGWADVDLCSACRADDPAAATAARDDDPTERFLNH